MESNDIAHAIEIGSKVKFVVYIDVVSEDMTYLQLGTYLLTNAKRIECVKVVLKE